jgi:Co/Zn/Cd efflux system component
MTMETSAPNAATGGMRRIVRLAAILNLTYFGVEFTVALAIGSVSLFADSIDSLEDTAVNFLILIALGWSARYRARIGMALPGFCSCPE